MPFTKFASFLPPSSLFLCERSVQKGQSRVVRVFYLGFSPNNPSDTLVVLRKDSRSIATARDVTELDVQDDGSGSWNKATLIRGNGGAGGGEPVFLFCNGDPMWWMQRWPNLEDFFDFNGRD